MIGNGRLGFKKQGRSFDALRQKNFGHIIRNPGWRNGGSASLKKSAVARKGGAIKEEGKERESQLSQSETRAGNVLVKRTHRWEHEKEEDSSSAASEKS